MVLRTRVSQATLCVTFGARRRWAPLNAWCIIFCNLGNQGLPRMLDLLLLMDVSAAEVALRCPQVVTSAGIRSGIFRWRERHAHEVA